MSLKCWTLSFAFLLPLLGVVTLSGCGPAPSNAPQTVEESPEALEEYNKRMKETGGRG